MDNVSEGAVALAEAKLQQGQPPKDRVFYARHHTAIKWTPYRPNSQEVKRGKMGRWQELRPFGIGWQNTEVVPEAGAWVEDIINRPELATRAAPPAMDREAVEADGYVLVPAVATRAMVDAADACVDAYSAYAAMVQTVGRKPIFAADVLTEQWLADVLQDTLEMDWNTIDGARGIVHALKNGLVTFPQTGGQIATASQITITPDLITLVKRLVVAGRTTGGIAGPDVGLMQALDDVERALSTLSADAIRQGEGKYLVWSIEHAAWWAPNEMGYTSDINGAGRYDRDAALAIVHRPWGWDRRVTPDEMLILERDAIALATPASHASDGGMA